VVIDDLFHHFRHGTIAILRAQPRLTARNGDQPAEK